MDVKSATLFDALLSFMAKTPKSAVTSEHIRQALPNLYAVWSNFTQSALADGYIDFVKHPGAPTHNFGIYMITPKGSKFILHDGGYTKLRKIEQYTADNLKFTWYRHWLWFIGFVLSFVLNLYLLFFKNA